MQERLEVESFAMNGVNCCTREVRPAEWTRETKRHRRTILYNKWKSEEVAIKDCACLHCKTKYPGVVDDDAAAKRRSHGPVTPAKCA